MIGCFYGLDSPLRLRRTKQMPTWRSNRVWSAIAASVIRASNAYLAPSQGTLSGSSQRYWGVFDLAGRQ